MNKNIWIIGGVVVVLLCGIFFFFKEDSFEKKMETLNENMNSCKNEYFHGYAFQHKTKFASKRWLDEVDYVSLINKNTALQYILLLDCYFSSIF